MEIFLRHGYERVSLEDLEEICRVPHGTLTTKYNSKQQLAAAAIDWYYSKYSQRMKSAMEQQTDICSAVKAALYAFIEFNYTQGEVSKDHYVRSIIDISRIDTELNQEFERLQHDWELSFIGKFEQYRDQLSDPSKAEGLAQFYLTTIEGLYEVIKSKPPRPMVFGVADLSLDVVKANLKQSPEH
ncbi:TetR/AcrR family transcriptional regulator [Pseudovibrio sp. Tun.PSC04-5.I4]|uniref:TetR/AcrR family transcriptional regulator n=1 Tax=Pseudovibrio sp. Tun.PSC04-5.I4 TaxID=1798213 RepID=UPI0013565215|nr:TetR/AcrR family transcriptional regulator [Pseudovibrio sp. Tun.PSC04-5.I4]